MSINTDFFIEEKAVTWNGHQVVKVRGITPNDLAHLITEESENIESIIDGLDRDIKPDDSIDHKDPKAVAAVVQAHSKKMIVSVMKTAPDLVAKLIAIACDDFDQWPLVRDRFVLPLQLEILTEIARLTFVDSAGFKDFVGNVMALVQSASASRPTPQVTRSRPVIPG